MNCRCSQLAYQVWLSNGRPEATASVAERRGKRSASEQELHRLAGDCSALGGLYSAVSQACYLFRSAKAADGYSWHANCQTSARPAAFAGRPRLYGRLAKIHSQDDLDLLRAGVTFLPSSFFGLYLGVRVGWGWRSGCERSE